MPPYAHTTKANPKLAIYKNHPYRRNKSFNKRKIPKSSTWKGCPVNQETLSDNNASEDETQHSNEESGQDEELLERRHDNLASPPTVEVEILPFPSPSSSTRPPLVVYINTTEVERDEGDVISCRLSKVIPLLVPYDSPIKDPNVKLYRHDDFQRFVPLGRGDVVTDPSGSVETVGRHQLMDKHRLIPKRLDNGAQILSGVKIFVEQLETPMSSETDNVHENHAPASPPPIAPPVTGLVTPPISDPPTTPPPVPDDTRGVEELKILWLQAAFRLNRNMLPGMQRCVSARSALRLHVIVSLAKLRADGKRYGDRLTYSGPELPSTLMIEGGIEDSEPPTASAAIKGQLIRQDEVRLAFGIGHTRWFDVHKHWDKIATSNALTLMKWVLNPDELIPGTNRQRYRSLNSMPQSKILDAMKEDEDKGYDLELQRGWERSGKK